MGYKRITTMDSWEIIFRWHSGQSIRHIARTLGYDRKAVRQYINRAKGAEIKLEEPLPERDQVMELLEGAMKELGRPVRVRSILEPLLPEVVSLVDDPHIALKPSTVEIQTNVQILHIVTVEERSEIIETEA